MENASKSTKTNHVSKKPSSPWWIRILSNICRKAKNLEAKVQQNKATKTADEITADATKWMMRFTFVLAAVGILTVIFLRCQLEEARGNDALASRAWIAPVSTALRSEASKVGDGTIFVVPYSNTGKTPAFNVNSWINRTDSLEKIGDMDPVGSKANMLLAPDGIGNTSTADIPIAPTDVEHIKAGTLTVYIYGTISYEDVYGKAHWTQFCFYPGADLKSFGPCGKHNTTDDKHNPKPN